MEKSVQPETKYTNDEDEYIQKTFSDKSLTYFQIEKCFEERFKRRLTYDTLLNRNEYLLVEEANQATNNVAISQRACANDPEAEVMLLSEDIIDELKHTLKNKKDCNETSISNDDRPSKKIKIDHDKYETFMRDFENLKKENENLKTENKITNERLKVVSDRKSKLNLDLKAENLKLNNELTQLRNRLVETEKQLNYLKTTQQKKEILSNNICNNNNNNQHDATLNSNNNENKLNYLNDQLDKLKNENLFLKIEKDKALSYAYHYVKKLKDFENALIKERLSQAKQNNLKDSPRTSLGSDNFFNTLSSSSSLSLCASRNTQTTAPMSLFSSSVGNYYININEILGRPIIKITESNGTKSVLNPNMDNNSNNRIIELNIEESKFLKNYMLKIENQLKNYLEESIKSYHSQHQDMQNE